MKGQRLQGSWYWMGHPDYQHSDRVSPPTVSITLYLDPENKPPRDQLFFELTNLVEQMLRKLDTDFYDPRFMDLAIAGTISPDQLDDYIGRWHDLPDTHPQRTEQLHEYLGMTWREYADITEKPSRIWQIIHDRRTPPEGNNSGNA